MIGGPEIVTLGCRLNAAESATIRSLIAREQDVIVVNTCAVTNEAVRQTRQAIRKAKRARPGARIFVTGCAAQIEPETFATMPEVARVIPNHAKLRASSYGFAPAPGEELIDPDVLAAESAGRCRAFVAVQNGCDHRCTFCIIPFGRGASRSVPAGRVIRQIEALVAAGIMEIVLTGVDLTSYGADLPGSPTLGLLIERILKAIPGLKRLRLSSLDCIELDERLFELAAEPRLMPHFHLSLQAGDDMILKRMKRRHSRAEAIATVRRLKNRRPDAVIGADLIAGFPTETAAMHENSMRLLDDCDIVFPHVFPFSPKQGTPAARMPQVASPIVRRRARQLREAGAARRRAWLDGLIGTEQEVLVERADGSGHCENFAPARVTGSVATIGDLVRCRITASGEAGLEGAAA